MEIGFSENEAKAYMALLLENPSTAYDIAKRSAVPTSKIYEVLAKLSEKGAVFEIDDKEKCRYVPLPPDELITNHKNRLEGTLAELREGLNELKSNADLSFMRTIRDYGYLLDKARQIIEDARETVLLSVWPRELDLLKPALKQSIARGVKIAIVHFGQTKIQLGQIFAHPIEDTIFAEKGGQGLVVVTDSKEVLFAKVTNTGTAEGVHSISKGFVAMAEDYIKHDIYIMKIVNRFNKSLISKFGTNYHKLRDVFKDEEL